MVIALECPFYLERSRNSGGARLRARFGSREREKGREKQSQSPFWEKRKLKGNRESTSEPVSAKGSAKRE